MNIECKGHHIFAFSDTHGKHSELKIPSKADILICAGDAVNGLTLSELQDFFNWNVSIPVKLRIFVAGNHELVFSHYLKFYQPLKLLLFKRVRLSFQDYANISVES